MWCKSPAPRSNNDRKRPAARSDGPLAGVRDLHLGAVGVLLSCECTSASIGAVCRSDVAHSQKLSFIIWQSTATEPIAVVIASINRSTRNGLCRYATQPKSMACRRCVSSWDPVMNMMGNSKPVAERCWPNSTPEMSPSWMSTTRHDASVVIAARTNSSADAYTSVRYPNPESKFCRAVRIPASSSMIAITFRFVAIDLPWYWSVSRADWLSSTNRIAGASQRSKRSPGGTARLPKGPSV